MLAFSADIPDTTRLLLAVLALLLLGACSTRLPVRVQPAPGFDIAAFATYHLQPVESEGGVDPGFALRNRESGELVWVGWVEGRKRGDSEQRIGDLIDAILQQLPGGPPTARLEPVDRETHEMLRERRQSSLLARRC